MSAWSDPSESPQWMDKEPKVPSLQASILPQTRSMVLSLALPSPL